VLACDFPVLHIEALSPSGGEVFWSFVEAGGYEMRQASDTGQPMFDRFQKPDPKLSGKTYKTSDGPPELPRICIALV